MRAVLWLVGLFAAAVALALFAGDNEGTVTIFWPPHRVDLSVNLVIVLLAAAFALLHLALRGLAALAELPRQARRWRLQQKERAVHALLLDALVQLSAGRYLRARKSARHALAREAALRAAGEPLEHAATLCALAHLAAAESAHALQDRALREHHLQQALAAQGSGNASGAARPPAQELREGLHLRAARWAVQERDPAAALAWIDGLPHGAARRTLALRTRLKAAQQAGHTAAALDTARLLVKHRAFSADAGRSLVRSLVAERLADTHDAAQLAQAWAALTPAERAEPELALKAAARLAALGGSAATVRAWLQPVWQPLAQPGGLTPAQRVALVRALETGLPVDEAGGADETRGAAPASEVAATPGGQPDDATARDWLARIEAAQKSNPRDPALQYLAGMACLQRQLWGKAQLLLTQAARGLQDADLRRRAWIALATLAEQRGDEAAALQAWRQAAQAPLAVNEGGKAAGR